LIPHFFIPHHDTQQRTGEMARILFQLRQLCDHDREQKNIHMNGAQSNSSDFTITASTIETNRVMRQMMGGQLQSALSHLISLYTYEDDEITLRFNTLYQLVTIAIDYNKEFDNISFRQTHLITEAERMATYAALYATKVVKKNTIVKMFALRESILPCSSLSDQHGSTPMYNILLSGDVQTDDDRHLFSCNYFSGPFETILPLMTPTISDSLIKSMHKYQYEVFTTPDTAMARMARILYIRQMSQLCCPTPVSQSTPASQRLLKLKQDSTEKLGPHANFETPQSDQVVIYVNRLQSLLSKMDALKMDAIFPYHSVGGDM